jgi:site-specific recombinase XerD
MWTDLPKTDEPLPKFLDDDQAARFMAAAVRLNPQRRLVVEMLARTGLRVTEFCELTHDAIVKMTAAQTAYHTCTTYLQPPL